MYSGDVGGTYNNSDVRFTENKNQWNTNILYKAQLDGGIMFLEKDGFTYNFYDKETLRKNHGRNKDARSVNTTIKCHAFRTTFLGALPMTTTISKNPTPDYCNYFIGKENKWASGVKNFREVNYKNLYERIDLQLLGFQNSVKYNFIVAPLGNTNDIKINYEGLDQIFLAKGTLHLKTSINEIIEQSPYAYQWIGSRKVEVPCEFVLENKTVRFIFPQGYNKAYELIIDPVLVFACSSGSYADNFGMTATYDSQGNLYSGGTCFDVGFPITLGAYDTTYNGIVTYGRTDVVITKYDSSGKFLQYSTYLGGSDGTEIVTSMVVDGQNNLFLYGATGSKDFPVTAGAIDPSFNGGIRLRFVNNGTYFDNGTDIYVSKLNSTGTALLGSTYIGGTMNDGVNVNNDSVLFSTGPPKVYEFPSDSLQYNYGDQYRGEINVDKFGNVFIASSTRSGNFPIVNGFDKKLDGKQDAVILKLNNNLTNIIWSSFLGGSDNDAGYALALDNQANVYITGGTRSLNFPATTGVKQPTHAGGKADGYIAKIKNDGSAILKATYWGTSTYDQTYFIQLDRKDYVYVVGQTDGKMPISAGVYADSSSGQFITKFDKTLDTVIFSTVFGNKKGIPNISPSAFLVDYCENIYVSGWGGNIITGAATTGMPITVNAIQPTTDGFNFYLFVLSKDAKSLFYATYFGGAVSDEHVDGGTSRFDKKGIVYQSVCAGCGGNSDFPVTPGSWPNDPGNVNHADNCNNGTFKLDFQIPIAQADFTVDHLEGCAPLTVHFKNQSTSTKILWDFGNGDTTSTVLNPIRTYDSAGIYLVKLFINDPASCNIWDTAFQYITVREAITADFDFVSPPCENYVSFSDLSTKNPVSWKWYFGDGDSSTVKNPVHIYNTSNTYNVTLVTTNSYGCKDTTVVQVDFANANATVSAATKICLGTSTQLLATGGFEYHWTPTAGLNNPDIPNPVATPTITTTYTVAVKLVNSLGDTCLQSLSTTVTVIDISSVVLSASADKDTLFKGESTTIHALTDTTFKIKWNPVEGVDNPTAFDTKVTPTVTTTYTVTIIGSSGCSKSDTVTIYVISNECGKENLFVPNTFTPNGDGKNDVLFVRSNNIRSAYFAVYNRWGELVFETTDFHKGWDGIYKGMKADPAVFAWYVKGICLNGNEFFKKGNVTLIR
jgi:gliding motility-associated-like protein